METKHDMFCPGQSRDFNGRTFLSGGDDASRVSIYEPDADSWVVAPQMNLLRGYQASTTISDGRSMYFVPLFSLCCDRPERKTSLTNY